MTETTNEQVTYTWTGRPGVVWIERPPLPVFLLMQSAAALAGFMLAVALFVAPAPRTVAEFTDQQKQAAYLEQETWPMVMTLRIVSREQFAQERPSANTSAFSFPLKNPCEIVIPAGWGIEAYPSRGRANFAKRTDGDILAHEMLHCLRGSWHPGWPEIEAARR